MKIEQITPFIGAEMSDVTFEDLARPEHTAVLVDALDQHELVVIRSIDLSPEQQIDLARRIGTPVPFVLTRYRHPDHPEIMISSNEVKANKPVGVARVGNFWHQDSTFVADPAPYTMLHGVNVPSTTGHTLFASAKDVYDRIPAVWKTKLDGRTGVHTVAKRLRIAEQHVGLSVAELLAHTDEKHPRVRHPLIRTEPVTGRRYLYGSREYMHSVLGFDANDNEAFFSLTDELIQDPDHVYTHRWTQQDLVMWKTATTFHAATAVTPGVPRTVHRISIAAGTP